MWPPAVLDRAVLLAGAISVFPLVALTQTWWWLAFVSASSCSDQALLLHLLPPLGAVPSFKVTQLLS